MIKTYGVIAKCGSCGITGYWELTETRYGPVCKTGDVEAILTKKDEHITELKAYIKELRHTLQTIVEWKLPRIKDRNGNDCSYASQYGSNGERDYMRNLATKALHPTPQEKMQNH